ncbi:hypothetical protein ACN1C3_14265 [Pseudomonas sp. H11T01]|uniref:hypothetical protein n=1 Tax=Pseudomonas sp. H11T01 TaxID=3402749 RepID=UPI003ACA04CC
MEVNVMEERIAFLKNIATRARGTPALVPKAVIQANSHDDKDLESFHFNLKQEFPFIANFLPLSVEDTEALYGLFQWLANQLIEGSAESICASLLHVLEIGSVLDLGDGQLWRELERVGSLRLDRLEQLTQLIFSQKFSIKRYHRHMDHVDDLFLNGCILHDWESVDSVLHHVTDFLYDARFSCAVRLLSIFSPLSLERVLGELKDVAVLIAAIEFLSSMKATQTLQIAVNSNSWPLKFCALRLSLDRNNTNESSELEVFWEQLLLQGSNNSQEWSKWVAVFNTYPSRYPRLQSAMGAALCGMSKAALIQYFDVISLSTASNRKDLMPALKRVQQCSDEVQRNLIWTLAFNRWQAWNFNISDPNSYIFSIQDSALDFAVAMYYHDCLSDEERDRAESRLRTEFDEINNLWYETFTDYVSAFNRHLSRFQPLGHAQQKMYAGDDWMDGRHWYSPGWCSKHSYWEIRNRL